MPLQTLTMVAWAAHPLNGVNDMTSWMIDNGSVLLDAINKACAAQGFAHGSGTMHPEIQAKTMLNYGHTVSLNRWKSALMSATRPGKLRNVQRGPGAGHGTR